MPYLSQLLHIPGSNSKNSSSHDLQSETGRSVRSNSTGSNTIANTRGTIASVNPSVNSFVIPNDSSQVWKSLNGSPGFSLNKEVDKIKVQLKKLDTKLNKELALLESVSADKLKAERMISYKSEITQESE